MQALYEKGLVTQSTYDEWLRQGDPEKCAMLPRWLLEIMFFYVKTMTDSSNKRICESVGKSTKPISGGYYISKKSVYSNNYERYLDALCKTGYINTPSEWTDFGDNAKMINANVLAMIAKVGDYSVKD